MNKQLNPNLVSTIFVITAILVVAILPVSIRVETNTGAAQPAKVVEYTLRMVLGQTPPMAFMGIGGDIDGQMNPELRANAGDQVKITVINSDPVLHDFRIDDFGVTTGEMTQKDQAVTVEFTANKAGAFNYYCSVPGHKDIGMGGKLVIAGEVAAEPAGNGEAVMVGMENPAAPTAAPAAAGAVSIIHDPTDLPGPVGNRPPMTVRVDLTTQEVTGQLADGTTFKYFTFNGTIPGPMIRVRVGDTIDLHLKNDTTSLFPHSIDLHAVTGPGGGAVFTQTNPGSETTFTFQALNPGLYVYHCATPSVAHHIAMGMYGLILVEPEGGLPPVDHEFYLMQGEVYTAQPFGTPGNLDFSMEKMLDEDAEYLILNGAAGALTHDDYALRAKVGETVRIFFGVGGPNYTSSFHVIGEIFDRVYDQASLTANALTDVQTTTVPPGGATMVEFTLQVPGRYILVDHALSRLERGLAGYLYAEGADNPTIFHGEQLTAGSGH